MTTIRLGNSVLTMLLAQRAPFIPEEAEMLVYVDAEELEQRRDRRAPRPR